MKKLVCLLSIALLGISCSRDNENNNTKSEDLKLACNKIVNANSVVSPWGVLSRTTCKPGPGIDAPNVPSSSNKLLAYKSELNTANINTPAKNEKVKTKSVHFWFYGTNSQKLFKPVTYARVFVFDNDSEGNRKVETAKQQIQSGNHYLGFDSGVFKDVYPYVVININHKNNTNGSITTSFNLENEVKKSIPVGKRVFIQFIVQTSPTKPAPSTFATSKYAYCDFVNEDNQVYHHYKIDLSDTNLGYQGNQFYYPQTF